MAYRLRRHKRSYPALRAAAIAALFDCLPVSPAHAGAAGPVAHVATDFHWWRRDCHHPAPMSGPLLNDSCCPANPCCTNPTGPKASCGFAN